MNAELLMTGYWTSFKILLQTFLVVESATNSSGKMNPVNFTRNFFNVFINSTVSRAAYGQKSAAVISVIENSYAPVPPLNDSDHWGWLKVLIDVRF